MSSICVFFRVFGWVWPSTLILLGVLEVLSSSWLFCTMLCMGFIYAG